jgi:hypothetical protein
MKFLLMLALVPAGLVACASPQPEPGDPAATADIADPTRTAEDLNAPLLTDPNELAVVARFRQEWVSAFQRSNPDPVEFMFQQEAVFLTDDQKAQLGDAAESAAALFAVYDAELAFTGGQTIDEAQNWVVDWPEYRMTLTPKSGGEALELEGTLFVRHHRDEYDVLRLALGPAIGGQALDFNLNTMSGDGSFRLSDPREKPVVLVFGSYT